MIFVHNDRLWTVQIDIQMLAYVCINRIYQFELIEHLLMENGWNDRLCY